MDTAFNSRKFSNTISQFLDCNSFILLTKFYSVWSPCHLSSVWWVAYMFFSWGTPVPLSCDNFRHHDTIYGAEGPSHFKSNPWDNCKETEDQFTYRYYTRAVVKNPPANAENASSIPGSGRSLGGGNGSPVQYSCLENPMDRRTWRATVHEVTNIWHDLMPKQYQLSQGGALPRFIISPNSYSDNCCWPEFQTLGTKCDATRPTN